MNANELRIGNIVNPLCPAIVKSLSSIENECCCKKIAEESVLINGIILSLNDIEPIPLTEEWLLHFRFKYYRSWNYWQIKGQHRLKVHSSNIGFYFRERFHFEIQHVHQLQNLYFALTGEELIIK